VIGKYLLPIRPPGSDEESIASKCIRCGECIKACPAGVIQANPSPVSWEVGWTPVLNMRFGYCDYGCNACGNACPTGAISKLKLAQKQKTIIGKATIDQKRCIPWAEGRDCIVCEEMCPVSPKAISLDDKAVTGKSGNRTTVHLPRMHPNRCIGCGICETKCPVSGEAAIRVFP
jgi:MauM/NapG family ferredoxin protein